MKCVFYECEHEATVFGAGVAGTLLLRLQAPWDFCEGHAAYAYEAYRQHYWFRWADPFLSNLRGPQVPFEAPYFWRPTYAQMAAGEPVDVLAVCREAAERSRLKTPEEIDRIVKGEQAQP